MGPHARRIADMDESARISFVLSQVEKIYPHAGKYCEGGVSKCWDLDAYSLRSFHMVQAGGNDDDAPAHREARRPSAFRQGARVVIAPSQFRARSRRVGYASHAGTRGVVDLGSSLNSWLKDGSQ